jgi:DNA ligase-1
MTFDALAQACERVAASPGRNKKIAILAACLREFNERELVLAARFLSGQPVESAQRTPLGHAALREALIEATGWDLETVRLCYRETGDTGETIGLLLDGATRNLPLALEEAEQHYLKIFASKTKERPTVLSAQFVLFTPLTLKYFVKVLTGNFRIGLQEKLVEEAIAQATSQTAAAVRDANNKSGDLAKVAALAYRGELESVEARLFHPMEFMLAKPIESLPPLTDASEWLVEDKFDGIRAQIHVSGGKVRIYTRGLEDATASFPDVVEMFQTFGGTAVFDGEILAWNGERALNFTVLQQRLQRKKVTAEILASVPVAFIAYDLLLDARPLEDRKNQLERYLAHFHPLVLISSGHALVSLEAIDEEFLAARQRGNEGLLLKKRGSLYEPGRRGGNWIKVKKAFATLDVVITAAEQGHGRRATMLSDYTFAVRDGSAYVNVGKAYSGLTDEEIRELTKILRSLAIERYGRVLLVQPEIVLEVAFDGIQKSPRHKSGFALRFPRILQWRKDKGVHEIDELAQVKALYEASLNA